MRRPVFYGANSYQKANSCKQCCFHGNILLIINSHKNKIQKKVHIHIHIIKTLNVSWQKATNIFRNFKKVASWHVFMFILLLVYQMKLTMSYSSNINKKQADDTVCCAQRLDFCLIPLQGKFKSHEQRGVQCVARVQPLLIHFHLGERDHSS